MIRKGIGDDSTFKSMHPAVNLIFYTIVLAVTMFSMSPVFLAAAFVCSWGYSLLLGGVKQLRTNLLFMIPVIIFMVAINTFFTHNGMTVLCYINGMKITLEALLYGIAAAVLLTAVIVWFSSFNIIMSSDKLIYVFGKAAPVLGLTLSMIFRFIPLLRERFREISMGQRAMGRPEEKKFIPKMRRAVKELSILISWSLEAAIETSDSMEARGYGLPGRTSFHLFKMSPSDKKILAAELILGGISIAGLIAGRTSIYYYPKIVLPEWDIITAVVFGAYLVLMLIPIVIDIAGEIKWQRLQSEI